MKMNSILNALESLFQKYPEEAAFDQGMENLKGFAVPDFMNEDEFYALKWTFFPKPSEFDSPEDEEGVEASDYHRAHSKSMANMELYGWFNQSALDRCLQQELVHDHLTHGLKVNGQVREDVIRNSAHILTRCNDPKDWAENKCGLVYGMVQSGKTNSMLALTAMAYDQGYDMVVVLTSRSVDLRQQTQNRFDAMFRHGRAVGAPHGGYVVTTKTEASDKYPGNRSPYEHFQGQSHGRLKHYLVLKKNASVLTNYAARIEEYVQKLAESGHAVRALVLDDEADHSSLNTKKEGETRVHQGVGAILDAFHQVDYIAYTATPQGCIAQDIEAKFGYPRDFIWVLDPYIPKTKAEEVMTGSYIGGYEFFSKFSDKAVAFIEEDDWPQHKLANDGKYLGIHIPDAGIDDTKRSKLTEVEHDFLKAILAGRRELPKSLVRALLEFIWTGCYRWLDHGADPTTLLATEDPLHDLVPDHTFMANITYITENQNLSSRVIARAWEAATQMFEEGAMVSEALGEKLRKQCAFFQAPTYTDEEVKAMSRPFIREVSRSYPVRDKKGELRQSDGFIYVLNFSTEDVLNYTDDEARVKAAAIVLGGNKLSRGLTVEGLAISYYGRSQRTSLADTVTQMGRWFGHKHVPNRSYLHLLRTYMHRDSLRLFRDIAFEELRFRADVKESIAEGHTPSETLYIMEETPLFKLTNAQKGRQLANTTETDYRRNRAIYKRFSPNLEDLKSNSAARQTLFDTLGNTQPATPVWNRGRMWHKADIDVVMDFLTNMQSDVATGASPESLLAYLHRWKREAKTLQVNIVDMTEDGKKPDRRKRNAVPADIGPDNVPSFVECELSSLLGGSGDNSDFLSDSVIDFSEHKGHTVAELQAKRKTPLFLLYRIDVNYLSKKLNLDESHVEQGYIPYPKGALAYAMIFPRDNRPRSQSRYNQSVAAQL